MMPLCAPTSVCARSWFFLRAAASTRFKEFRWGNCAHGAHVLQCSCLGLSLSCGSGVGPRAYVSPRSHQDTEVDQARPILAQHRPILAEVDHAWPMFSPGRVSTKCGADLDQSCDGAANSKPIGRSAGGRERHPMGRIPFEIRGIKRTQHGEMRVALAKGGGVGGIWWRRLRAAQPRPRSARAAARDNRPNSPPPRATLSLSRSPSPTARGIATSTALECKSVGRAGGRRSWPSLAGAIAPATRPCGGPQVGGAPTPRSTPAANLRARREHVVWANPIDWVGRLFGQPHWGDPQEGIRQTWGRSPGWRPPGLGLAELGSRGHRSH